MLFEIIIVNIILIYFANSTALNVIPERALSYRHLNWELENEMVVGAAKRKRVLRRYVFPSSLHLSIRLRQEEMMELWSICFYDEVARGSWLMAHIVQE